MIELPILTDEEIQNLYPKVKTGEGWRELAYRWAKATAKAQNLKTLRALLKQPNYIEKSGYRHVIFTEEDWQELEKLVETEK